MKITSSIAAGLLLAAGFAHAQQPAQPAPTGPAPTGLIVGSGNYFSPIVADLGQAVAFYRDGLGLDVQGEPADASANPALRNMFGLPDAKLRWQIARTPAASGGVEIIEVSGAGGTPLDRQIQDVGSVTLVVTVRDLDATFARLKKLGAPTVTAGGAPTPVARPQKGRAVVVKDPAGHFVEIVQPESLPVTQAPPTANVVAVRVAVTVADAAESARLYGGALGLEVVNAASPDVPAGAYAAYGATPTNVARLRVPTSGLVIDFVEFADAPRAELRGRVQDPGSTRMQLRVADIDAAIAAFKKVGGEVVSTGGAALDLPAGNGTLKVAIVRDPNNLFVVLIQAPPPAA